MFKMLSAAFYKTPITIINIVVIIFMKIITNINIIPAIIIHIGNCNA